jgi:hypothetical protein
MRQIGNTTVAIISWYNSYCHNTWLAHSCWLPFIFLLTLLHLLLHSLHFFLAQHHKGPPPCLLPDHNADCQVDNVEVIAEKVPTHPLHPWLHPPHIVQKPIPAISHKEKKEHDPPSAFGKHVSCITARWRVLASVQMLCLKAAAILPRSRLHNKSQLSKVHTITYGITNQQTPKCRSGHQMLANWSFVCACGCCSRIYQKVNAKEAEKRQTRGGGGGGDKSTLPTVLSSRPIGSKALKLMTLWKGKGQNCIQRETPQDVVHDGVRLQEEAI